MTQKEKAQRYDKIVNYLKTNYFYWTKTRDTYGLDDIQYGDYRAIFNIIATCLPEKDKEETIYK